MQLGGFAGNGLAGFAQIRGRLRCACAMLIPSQARRREGVETRRARPKGFGLWSRESPDCKRRKAVAKAIAVRILGQWVRIPPRGYHPKEERLLFADEKS